MYSFRFAWLVVAAAVLSSCDSVAPTDPHSADVMETNPGDVAVADTSADDVATELPGDTSAPPADTSTPPTDTSVPPADTNVGTCNLAANGHLPSQAGTCRESVLQCLVDGGNPQTCYAPESPACLTCVQNDVTACVVRHGCGDAWKALACCAESACGDGDYGCIQAHTQGGNCRSEYDAYRACENREFSNCTNVLSVSPGCFESLPASLCFGSGSTMGEYDGAPIAVDQSRAFTDEGAFAVLLSRFNEPTGEKAVLVALQLIEGQLSYSYNSGLARCAILEATPQRTWRYLLTSNCDVNLTALHFAEGGRCNGFAAGGYSFIIDNQGFGGTFGVPHKLSAGEVIGGGCRPRDASCQRNDQCCSNSCSPVLGICF